MTELMSGTDEDGVSITLRGDIIDIKVWGDGRDIHTESMTLGRFMRELGI